jgi:flavin reductase (DIM6/NTAB) family NADH-FMN oxidoreductase RutF
MPEHPVVDSTPHRLVELPLGATLWERVFMPAPLVLVATKEGDGFDVATKHMAMPFGWEGFYGFVCSPRHATYRNLLAHPQFTIGMLRPEQIVPASLAAAGRLEGGDKPSLTAVPTMPARVVDVPLVVGCALHLECELERLVDGFGRNSLIVGRVVAASAMPDVVRAAETDDADLVERNGVLAYLAPGRFAVVRESHAFPYPVDFRI